MENIYNTLLQIYSEYCVPNFISIRQIL